MDRLNTRNILRGKSINWKETVNTVFSAVTMWKKLLSICSSAAPSVEPIGSTRASNGIMQGFLPDVDASKETISEFLFCGDIRHCCLANLEAKE
jgi:hypothetical protein